MSFYNSATARIPVSTYRLQFNKHFRFSDARDIARYLHALGISDIYASPYLGAKKGSLHGYDIVDHNMLNPEIGTSEEYDDFVQELRKYGMGQLLDIVPNHMGIGSENAWWMDLLENGMSSAYSKYFDIEWDPVKRELKDKVLLPVLGDQYGKALENREITLSFQGGAFFINYYDHSFPVRPQTYIPILKHDIETLESRLTDDSPHFTELLSIITALEHLPPYTEEDPEKIRERQREKEVIKKRLWSLHGESPDIRDFINGNVKIFNGVKGEPRSFDLLDSLLSAQVYRLSHWRVATEEINYRRFFDINELAAIKVENEEVFGLTHKLILELVRQGKVTGLRVDHPDGLYNPSAYFMRLQRECFINARTGVMMRTSPSADLPDYEAELLRDYMDRIQEDPHFKPFYIVGEKILLKGERMPEDWPIFSTTGYVFLNSLNGIFVDTNNAKAFDEIYARFIKAKINFHDIFYEKKKLIMKVAMSSEVNMLGHYLNRLSEKDRHTRDFTLNSLIMTIIEVIAYFPVYRTYITESGVNDRDRKYIELAVNRAKRRNPAVSESVFDFLKDVLLLNYYGHFGDSDKREWRDFVMRFQQITGPVMAKGVEDTAFYVYNRFVSLNEVGGSPERFGTPLETFHGQNIERTKYWPHALITTSTHDTKRGEDVRARLNVLSEIPGEWKDCLVRWKRLNRKRKMLVGGDHVPDRNEEYLLYQTLIGAWPAEMPGSGGQGPGSGEKLDQGGFEGEQPSKDSYEHFKQRIRDYMLKALREAKVNSSWISPNTIYEDVFTTFIERILGPYQDNPFLKDFLPFQKKISHYGMFNSLSQTLLKITSPGVADFYQGTELWDFSLVDPDNRRPVDYGKRIDMLEEIQRRGAETGLLESAKDLLVRKEDGWIKMYLIFRALNYRGANRELFEKGEYVPVEAFGERANNVCAFARRLSGEEIIVVAPRLLAGIGPNADFLPFGEKTWGGSFIAVAGGAVGSRYRNIFTGEEIEVKKHEEQSVLYLSDVFANFPAALLEVVKV